MLYTHLNCNISLSPAAQMHATNAALTYLLLQRLHICVWHKDRCRTIISGIPHIHPTMKAGVLSLYTCMETVIQKQVIQKQVIERVIIVLYKYTSGEAAHFTSSWYGIIQFGENAAEGSVDRLPLRLSLPPYRLCMSSQDEFFAIGRSTRFGAICILLDESGWGSSMSSPSCWPTLSASQFLVIVHVPNIWCVGRSQHKFEDGRLNW